MEEFTTRSTTKEPREVITCTRILIMLTLRTVATSSLVQEA